MTLADFADYLEQGGIYPDGIPFTRQAVVTAGTTVRPEGGTAIVQFRAYDFTLADGTALLSNPGANLITTEGPVAGIDWIFRIEGGMTGPGTGFQGSLTWFRSKTGNAQNPTVDVWTDDWYPGPGVAGTGCQPNLIQANSDGGTFDVTHVQRAGLPQPTMDEPFAVPDDFVCGGGPGFVANVTGYFAEFDQSPATGIKFTGQLLKVLIGALAEGTWSGATLNVNGCRWGLDDTG